MRLTFWKADKGYENALAPLLAAGAKRHGDEIVVRPLEEYRKPMGDGGLICGVVKREVLWDHQAKGAPLLYLDKGYYRDRRLFRGNYLPSWWRLCWQDVHPTAYLMVDDRPDDRWKMLGQQLGERADPPRDDAHIVLLGSSAKFHETMKILPTTAWANGCVNQLREFSSRRIIYRPKPSWGGAVPVPHADFEHGRKVTVQATLAGAFASVTYGSIACVDSIIAGVPCIVLGDGVARPICSDNIEAIKSPFWASRPHREQWAANLCYSHFTPSELENGTAWNILKGQMAHAF